MKGNHIRFRTFLSMMAICLSCFAWAASAWGGDYFISLQSAGDADELGRSDLTGLARRRFSQSLYLSGIRLLTDERNSLQFVVRGRVFTDFARSVEEDAQDPRDQDAVDFNLQLAYIEFTPMDQLSVKAGRILLFGPLPGVDLDGASVQVHNLAGFGGQIAFGREVRYGQSLVDGGLFDAIGSRWTYFDDPSEQVTWLSQGEVGWSNRWIAARAGHRVSWRYDDRVSQLTAWVGRLNLEGWDTSFRGTFNHLMEGLDQLGADVTVPLEVMATRARLEWTYYRPWFDGDSIFNVFPISPWVGWQLGAEIQPVPYLDIFVTGRQRAFAIKEEVPWLGGLDFATDEFTAGGEVKIYAQCLPVLHVRGGFSADAGYSGTLLDSEAAASWQVMPERLELGFRLRYAYFTDIDGSLPEEHLMAVRLRGGYRLSSFGDLNAYFESATNLDTTIVFRAMGLVTFDLGPF